ncbi:MAG: hypothetical protein ACO3GL_07770, partial [Bacteroidia bacterium]
RLLWEQEAVSSNLATPTSPFKPTTQIVGFFLALNFSKNHYLSKTNRVFKKTTFQPRIPDSLVMDGFSLGE